MYVFTLLDIKTIIHALFMREGWPSGQHAVLLSGLHSQPRRFENQPLVKAERLHVLASLVKATK